MGRRIPRILGIMALGVLPFVMVAVPVVAADPEEPTTVSLEGIVIFHDLITDGDFLAVVPYDISFGTAPDDGIDKTFIFRLLSPDGSTENGTAIAKPAYDKGYGPGVVSFYFSEGMVLDESYIFRVQENPTHYPTPEYWDFLIGSSDYSSAADQAAALKAKVIDVATALTPTFGVALLEKSEVGTTVLSTDGTLYFINAIPGLPTMCPSLFSVQLENPDYTKRSWSFAFAEALKTKYSDTFIGDFMTGFAGLFDMQTTAAMNILSIILFLGLTMLSVGKFKASMLAALTDGYTLLLLLMLMGFADMVMVGTIGFLSSTLGGVILFLNRA